MTKPLTCVFDAVTMQEVTREMTDEEYTQYQLDATRAEQLLAERLTNSATGASE